MGSTHPPLESLLTFSKNCLEGLEDSRRNRISNLRKEIRDMLEDWVESAIDARLARRILEGGQASGANSLSDQTTRADLVAPEVVLRNLAHGAEDIVSPSDDVLAPEFPCDPMLELHEGAALEVRLPFRRAPVSQDASAALRSLEHSARCKARSIRDRSMGLLNCPNPDSAQECLTLPFLEHDALHAPSNVAPPISHSSASTNQREPYVVRHAPAEPMGERTRRFARYALNLPARLRRPAATFLARYSFVVGSGGCGLRPLSPVRVSLRQSSLRRAAIFLRN